MPRAFLPLLLCLLSGAAHGSERSLVVVTPKSPWTLPELEALHLDLVSHDPETGETWLTVTPEEERLLVSRGYPVATVEIDADAGRRRLLEIPDLGLYHTYAETVAELESLQAAHPDLTRLESIGSSLEGRPILALKLSDEPEIEDPAEPDVLVVGNHHAREFMSVEVPLYLVRNLLDGYARNPRLRALLDSRELWVVPLLNPDGHVYQSETQLRPGWRKNRRSLDGEIVGVDLNRNYSYLWGYDEEGSSSEPLSETYRGLAPFSEPESDAIRRLVERQDFTLALSFHSFGRLVLFPWGYTRDSVTLDHARFSTMGDSMVRDNGYRPGNAYTGAIYLTNGVWDDFMYGELYGAKERRTMAFTVELNAATEGGFWPPEDLIEPTCANLWTLNLYALRVAGELEAVLPPAAPVLLAAQDAEDPRRIELRWSGPRGTTPVDFYEVFEIDPAGAGAALAAAPPVRLERADRALLVSRWVVPEAGSVALQWRGDLDPLWDRVRVELRPARGGDWQELQALGTQKNGAPSPPSHLAPRLETERRRWNAAAWAGQEVDLALHFQPWEDAPRRSWVEARLDVPAQLEESRRVVAVVHDTLYTVVATRQGLFAYGVTAVSGDGQRADSDIFWFSIPDGTPVALQDLEFQVEGGEARFTWRQSGGGAADFEVWARPLAAQEVPGSAEMEWAGGLYRRGATATVQGAGPHSLRFSLPGSRSAILFRTADGAQLWGPWVAQAHWPVALQPATPNPFNPSTRLRFVSDGSFPVTLEILRPDGKRVHRLLDAAALGPGEHEATWDGRDASGRRVAAGLYLATLRVGPETRVRRLVLLP